MDLHPLQIFVTQTQKLWNLATAPGKTRSQVFVVFASGRWKTKNYKYKIRKSHTACLFATSQHWFFPEHCAVRRQEQPTDRWRALCFVHSNHRPNLKMFQYLPSHSKSTQPNWLKLIHSKVKTEARAFRIVFSPVDSKRTSVFFPLLVFRQEKFKYFSTLENIWSFFNFPQKKLSKLSKYFSVLLLSRAKNKFFTSQASPENQEHYSNISIIGSSTWENI